MNRWYFFVHRKKQGTHEMTASPDSPTDGTDPFRLSRFITAQEGVFDRAIAEVRNGRKHTHWMWYIYPQLRGLGHSSTAHEYGITGTDEAEAYLAHELLGARLIAACEAALSVEGRSATAIFGEPDDKKLQSCATLFAHVSNDHSVFHRVLQKFFDGELDHGTLTLLENS